MRRSLRPEAQRLIRDCIAHYNDGDWLQLRRLFTDNANIRGVLGWVPVDQAMELWQELHANMNTRLDLIDIVCEGDAAAALLTETGRFVGPFRALPGHTPTGVAYELLAIEWYTFSENRIARRWSARDSGSLTRQVLSCELRH